MELSSILWIVSASPLKRKDRSPNELFASISQARLVEHEFNPRRVFTASRTPILKLHFTRSTHSFHNDHSKLITECYCIRIKGSFKINSERENHSQVETQVGQRTLRVIFETLTASRFDKVCHLSLAPQQHFYKKICLVRETNLGNDIAG